MEQQTPKNELYIPNWRIVMAVGTMGVYGEVDTERLSVLPMEIGFRGRVHGLEQVEVSQDEYGSSFVDWRLLRADHDGAAFYAIENTLDGFNRLGMSGTVLQAVYTSADCGLFGRSAPVAMRDMLDITELADEFCRITRLPDTISADDFR